MILKYSCIQGHTKFTLKVFFTIFRIFFKFSADTNISTDAANIRANWYLIRFSVEPYYLLNMIIIFFKTLTLYMQILWWTILPIKTCITYMNNWTCYIHVPYQIIVTSDKVNMVFLFGPLKNCEGPQKF